MKSNFKMDYQQLFERLPGQHIAFLPNDPEFTIVAQNKAHEKIAYVKPGEIIGQAFFDAFPDTSEKFKKTGVSEVAESFRSVIKTKKPHTMPAFRYDIKNENDVFVAKHWQVTHYPILDDNSDVMLIFQDSKDITKEVAQTKKLERAERRTEETLQDAGVGIWNLDVKNDKLTADKNLAAAFGVDEKKAAEGLPLKVFTDAIRKEDRPRVLKEIKQALKSQDKFESEYKTSLHGGIEKWVIARGRIERNKQGEAVEFFGVLIDMTDRKEVEEALRKRENELTFMADTIPQLVWVTRPDGYHEYYNQQWYDYTGTTTEQAQGEGWSEIFHEGDRKKAWKTWRHSLKTGEPYEIEYRLWHEPTQEYRWVVGKAHALCDNSGKILKWYGTCTDIHAQKMKTQNEVMMVSVSQALSKSLDYKKTLQNVAQLISEEFTDWCSVEILNNDRSELQQLAVSHRDPKKVKWAKELREQQGPPDLSAPQGLPNVIRTGKAELYEEITDEMLKASAKNKKELQLMRDIGMTSAMVVPLIIDGKPIGGITMISAERNRHYKQSDLDLAIMLADRASLAIYNSQLYSNAAAEIIERERLQEELEQLNQKLEERVKIRTAELNNMNVELKRSNKELEDFAYVASHDLQEPLRKIQAFSNLLEEEYKSKLGDGADYLTRMRNAAARMSSLINDLLAFSRITTKTLPPESLELGPLAEEVVENLEFRRQETKGDIKIGKLPTVEADPMQMRQLFQNLIGNALKFHRENVPPKIKVSAKIVKNPDTKRSEARILFEDNGIGFDEKYLERIFGVFQRLHARDKGGFEGTGIGLAICRKIVERHKGSINATSTPGKGSTFTVILPTKQPKENKHDR